MEKKKIRIDWFFRRIEEQNKAKLNKNQKLKTENEHLQAVLTTYKKMIEELNIANK